MAYFVKVIRSYSGFQGFKGRRENRPFLMTRQMAGLHESPDQPAAFVDRAEAAFAITAWEARVCNPYRLSDGERDRPTLVSIHSSKLPDYLRPVTFSFRAENGSVYLDASKAHRPERA
jgi:hypothetical protein